MPLSLLLIIAAAGLPIIANTTSKGIGLRDDSFSYFSGADGILAGEGYARFSELDGWKPLTNFPPLYSTLLTVPQLMGLEAGASARLLAGLSFAALAFLAGLLVFSSSQSLPTALLASGLILFSPSLLEVNSWALSEGPYLALMTASLFLLTLLLKAQPAGWLLLGANVVVLALAALTRYVGVVLIGTSFLAISLSKSGRRRIDLALSIAVASSIPLLLFLTRNWLIADSATNRPLPYWHPPEAENLLQGARVILSSIMPSAWVKGWSYPLLYGLAIAALLGLLLWIVSVKAQTSDPSKSSDENILGTLSLHALLYSSFLLFSLYFLDRLIPLNERLLAPAVVTLLMIGVILLHLLARSLFGNAKQWPVVLIAMILLAAQVSRGWPQLQSLAKEGMGFNQDRWRSSQTMEYVRDQPDSPIFTNNVPAMYFLANRNASFIPSRYDPAGDQPRQDYEDSLARMRWIMKEQKGLLVIIGPAPRNRLPEDHFKDLTEGLTLIASFGDGLVYEYTQE